MAPKVRNTVVKPTREKHVFDDTVSWEPETSKDAYETLQHRLSMKPCTDVDTQLKTVFGRVFGPKTVQKAVKRLSKTLHALAASR